MFSFLIQERIKALRHLGHSEASAKKYDDANQAANIAVLEILLEAAKDKRYRTMRLGQLLICAGVAKDDNDFWNYPSGSFLSRVEDFFTVPE